MKIMALYLLDPSLQVVILRLQIPHESLPKQGFTANTLRLLAESQARFLRILVVGFRFHHRQHYCLSML